MSTEPSLLALERNLALMAGAGAGKTYSLVTMTLHLLAGAREAGAALRPARLCMLTFTDKAAAEMRSRVRQRLDGLAQGEARLDQEVELRASLERLERPFPLPEVWRKLREELNSATVGTFHSLCGQLLRRAPPAVGIDPSFEVLDELEASSLVQDVCERVVLDALEAGDAQVRELCQELGFSGSGFSDGLVAALVSVYGKLREEGLRAASAAVGDVAAAREEFDEALTECLRLCADARALDAKSEWGSLLGALEKALHGMTAENFQKGDRYPWLRACFATDTRNIARLSKGAAGPVRELYWRIYKAKSGGTVRMLVEAWAAWHTAPFEATFRELLGRVETRHDAEFSRRNVFDFTSLLVKARDLLRDHPEFRRQVQERVGALLVDEFQDTNRLQLELVLLLAERREEGPRELTPDADLVSALPLEPAFLCAVGDRKQSIYEFRGADVSVFSRLAKKVEDEGGTRGFLQHNRRSVPGLLSFFNHAFAGMLVAADSQAPRPFEVIYVPEEDDLSPVRASLTEAPVVERLHLEEQETAGDLRWLDADCMARRLRILLAPGALPSVAREEGEGARPARGGDVAMLFRTFTHLEVYRQALIRHGVPHRVLRGRGFYGAQEVLDLASLLSLLADAEDSLAFAAVLRSPLVGLSDASLFQLAGEQPLSLTSPRLTDPSVLEALPEQDRERLEGFLSALPALRRERDRLGVRELLLAALDLTGYREALAGSPYAEQASANVEKLLSLASRRDERGTGGCVAFARELRMLAESTPNEAQADLLDAGDPRAVQLLTIHRAKGLEWPVVVVPGMGGRRRSTSARAHFERSHGIALRPWVTDSVESYTSNRFEAVKQELKSREDAEYRRLLYVALTRAKDLLILSGGEEPRSGKDSWWHLVDARLEDVATRELVTDVDVDDLPPPADPEPPGPEVLARAGARVEAALLRVRGGSLEMSEAPGRISVPVGAVQDFLLCPRRFHYVHRLGLRGAAWPWETPTRTEPLLVEPDGWMPTKSPDALVRELLRGADLRLCAARDVDVTERRAHLESLLRTAGMLPEEEGMEAVLGTVERFLRTDFALALAESPARGVHRGLSFSLALEEDEDLSLEGEVDVLWESPRGEAVLIAYKSGSRHPLGPAAYTHELAALELAARRLVRPGVPVRVGVVFLAEAKPEPEWRGDEEGLEDAAARLAGAARALARGEVRGAWSGRERPTCQALHCGFSEHCHPAPSAC
ncbi:ATP-dependent DNA helicase UvrD [Myxococcus stipitatus DSM 14675]|uniref:DNA 3'-5' helicase n=1 Tax=Myxococcus stipitatus (strain DSM 14675 / JCM 12634 / Mx s8) TaxID=1278073 RepID=L7U8Z7_MYXSD|nr:UvrD-helicase domain-containing protein [Myxococcus stipitatus]AGC44325.1 ATP-dependent DNA helicase UvrD [Myxococcus stipitatus DSM 14675]